MLVEGFLTVEPLNVVPDIWLGSMRDRNYDFTTGHNIVDKIRCFLVFFLELFCTAFWEGTLIIDNDWS